MMFAVDVHELLDAGDGARLERFGRHVVVRPHPAATQPRGAPDRWREADLSFDRDRGWTGRGLEAARDGWHARLARLDFELRPTDAGQVGLFPEHASAIPWLEDRLTGRTGAMVLNLFAYTGLVTLALARAGAAVAHVDAARPTVGWARRNAARNGLADRPIRWIVDDARSFVRREIRRGRRYDGVVLDPPTYGHGASGTAWRLERDLPALVDGVRSLVEPGGFILVTAHATALDAGALGAYLGPMVETGDLTLSARCGATLRLGAFARTSGAS